MANPGTPDAELRKVLAALEMYGTQAEAAKALKLNRGTFIHRVRMATAKGLTAAPPKEFERDEELPRELPSAAELLARRSKQFATKKAAKEARRLIDVKVTCDGPIGVALLGDPHVDDDGCDIELLQRHVEIINGCEGLFGACIGDYSNNWVGRLARLYGQQAMSAAEAWVLVEWLIRSTQWLVLVSGNHDAWSGDGDPIQWMAKSARVQYEAHGARIALRFPGTPREIRINARHDFNGRSQWNTAHGPAKAAQLGWRDHVLVCGHTHQSGHNVLRDPATGLISHALRIGSYKTFDRYADEKGLPNQTFMVAPVVVIRPRFADDDNRLISIFYDPETGADFLSFLRRRKSERAA
jgi:hypothetical protein